MVVPVRPGFEWAVHFYLHTGLPWLGGELPPTGDKTQNPLYLDIDEEITPSCGVRLSHRLCLRGTQILGALNALP